jgi:hypothetical protein
MQLSHLDDAIAVAQAGPPTVIASDQEERISRLILPGDVPPGLSVDGRWRGMGFGMRMPFSNEREGLGVGGAERDRTADLLIANCEADAKRTRQSKKELSNHWKYSLLTV